ncbi:MAG: hypothetical protein ACFFCW_14325 [Candidatus Hodarchaeota archaeon]
MNRRREIKYMHDGGPHKSTVIIQTKDYKDGMYRFEVLTNDVTDYHRFMDNIEWSVFRNIVEEMDSYDE